MGLKNMLQCWLIVLFQIGLFYVTVCEDIHPIKVKSNGCFDTYRENSTIYIKNLGKTCLENLPAHKSCVGLHAKSDDVVIVKCTTKMGKYLKLDEGCYRYINSQNKEEVVCQEVDEGRGCEIIKLPTGMNIEVYCKPLKPKGVIIIKQMTPKVSSGET